VEEVDTKTLSDRHCHLGEGCTYDPVTDTAWGLVLLGAVCLDVYNQRR